MKQTEMRSCSIRDGQSGLSAVFVNWGATLTALQVPLPDGTSRDVVLGYEDPESYRNNVYYLGATVAPCANRIGGAAFTLNGKQYVLEKNDGENNLHSGDHALHASFWEVSSQSGDQVTFSADCPDGENGFPGPLHVDVTYRVQGNALLIDYHGAAGQDTVFNPTNHSYFCLDEPGSMPEHVLTIYADQITPPDAGMIPDGTLMKVAGTPFDFRTGKKIGEQIDEADPLLTDAHGYDHNFLLNRTEDLRAPEYDTAALKLYQAAEVLSPAGGLAMDVYTDMPCMQFYTANWLSTPGGKGGVDYTPRSSFCLETQFSPNALHIPAFAQPVIRAGEDVYHRTVYAFRNR